MSSELTTYEKCGILGEVGPHVSMTDFKLGMLAHQHRGADAAGYIRDTGKEISVLRKQGSIESLYDGHVEEKTVLMIGHNRYATSEGITLDNAQPFYLTDGVYEIGLAHNGNIPSRCVDYLRNNLIVPPRPDASDSSIMSQTLLEARKKNTTWIDTFINTLPSFQGAFSLICTTDEKYLYAMRDPWGIKPLCIGRKGSEWITASESVALTAMGADYCRELLPGELICMKPNGEFGSLIYAQTAQPETNCALETIYFSKNESYDGYTRVIDRRFAAGIEGGKRLKQKGIKADLVVPVLRSGKQMSLGLSQELGIPNTEAIAVRGQERSFIQSTENKREVAVRQKHIVDGPMINGKVVVLGDDSLVRGKTMEVLIELIKQTDQYQPAEIHLVLAAEALIDICDLGIDLPRREDLISFREMGATLAETEIKVAAALGVTTVTFLDRPAVERAFGKTSDNMCWHCFGGPHPIHHRPRPFYRSEIAPELHNQRVTFMASGSGTHVQNFLENMEDGQILATPMNVITNQNDAGVIARAEKFGVKTIVLPSKGRLSTPEDREGYENELLSLILCNPEGLPDIIVLSGWMLILSDTFLKPLTDRGVDVINLHPALLSGTGSEVTSSSKGLIPELRGAHAVDDAHKLSLKQMPVTGATVHQVLPGSAVDTGKVLIREEVVRMEKETTDQLYDRVKAAEYRIFPIALQQLLMKRIARTIA